MHFDGVKTENPGGLSGAISENKEKNRVLQGGQKQTRIALDDGQSVPNIKRSTWERHLFVGAKDAVPDSCPDGHTE